VDYGAATRRGFIDGRSADNSNGDDAGCARRGRDLRAQGYVNAYAGIALSNDASVALHEACLFTYVGVFPSVGFKFGALA
jgi:hypothetical protein